jgi:hypothetical protein
MPNWFWFLLFLFGVGEIANDITIERRFRALEKKGKGRG